MANNRLFLKCKQCGEYVMLGKHFGGALHPPFDVFDKLLIFFEEHNYCDYTHYDLELCEEFPIEMTDNPYDELGQDWRLDEGSSKIAVDNVIVFNADKCGNVDFDSFPKDVRLYLASDRILGHMYCMSFNACTWTSNGMSWDEFTRAHSDEIQEAV